MAAWLSSTGISPHNLLRHIPSIHLSIVNSSPCPDCSTIPKLQLPATATSRVCMAVARSVWFSFHLGCYISAVSLSALNVSPLTQTIAPDVGVGPLLQFPHPPRAGPVLLTLPFPPLLPSSYRVLWLYIFFSAGQVLLSALSWCSACTSMSAGVFLMYPWREMYSMSTYSSSILSIRGWVFNRCILTAVKIQFKKLFLMKLKTTKPYQSPLQHSCLENPHGQRNLADFSPWGLKESDTTEWLCTSTELPHWKNEQSVWPAQC